LTYYSGHIKVYTRKRVFCTLEHRREVLGEEEGQTSEEVGGQRTEEKRVGGSGGDGAEA